MKPQPYIHITMPNPCNEDWSKMPAQGEGCYCDSCRKCVIDFTGFTDRQLYDYFLQHENEEVCGRFKLSQLNRHITLPHQPQSKRYRWIIAAGIVLFTVATPGTPTHARTPFAVAHNIWIDAPDTTTTGDSIVIRGVILNNRNEPVLGAYIILVKGDTLMASAHADQNGRFVIVAPSIADYELRISSYGYYLAPVVIKKDHLNEEHKIIMATVQYDDSPVLSGPPPLPVRRN